MKASKWHDVITAKRSARKLDECGFTLSNGSSAKGKYVDLMLTRPLDQVLVVSMTPAEARRLLMMIYKATKENESRWGKDVVG